ncbi:hypothetical protein HDU67_010403 [Dinochytrium kinnereticum]|nr:hypothetical protein HDU67_010403 [Dinochytrium kinnereticum]
MFFLVELGAGYAAGSLAILSDAFHLLGDIAGFGIALTAIHLSKLRPTPQYTYGYTRTELLGSLLSTILTWCEAENGVGDKHNEKVNHHDDYHHCHGHASTHIHHPPQLPVIRNKETDLNIRAATLHVIGDLLSSLGVLISSLILSFYPTLHFIDPICTLLFALLVIITTRQIFMETLRGLMESSPAHLTGTSVTQAVMTVPKVVDVHCCHVWDVSGGVTCASLHAIVRVDPDEAAAFNKAHASPTRSPQSASTLTQHVPSPPSDSHPVLKALRDVRRVVKEIGVAHVTVQIEPVLEEGEWEAGRCLGDREGGEDVCLFGGVE